MPSYLLDLELDPIVFALAHAGLPIVVTAAPPSVPSSRSRSVIACWRASACSPKPASMLFVGTGSTLHPMLSLEAGVFLDYEVLP